MEEKTKKMTKEEALKEGYTLCGFDGDEYQILVKIDDLSIDDILSHRIFIADKNYQSPTISSQGIKELLSEIIESDWGNDTGDDTEEVYKTIINLDFEPTAKMINDALSKIKFYKLTKIQITS